MTDSQDLPALPALRGRAFPAIVVQGGPQRLPAPQDAPGGVAAAGLRGGHGRGRGYYTCGAPVRHGQGAHADGGAVAHGDAGRARHRAQGGALGAVQGHGIAHGHYPAAQRARLCRIRTGTSIYLEISRPSRKERVRNKKWGFSTIRLPVLITIIFTFFDIIIFYYIKVSASKHIVFVII